MIREEPTGGDPERGRQELGALGLSQAPKAVTPNLAFS